MGKAGAVMSTHQSTQKGCAKAVPADCDSLVRFAELLKLRSLAATTQELYLRFVRKLAARHGGDPSGLDEAQVRAHLLCLKEAHHYSPSSMRTAVAAMRAFYGLHLGRDWKLFDLVRSPSAQTLPAVLTRAEVARLFSVIREERFRVILRLIYACGLRVSGGGAAGSVRYQTRRAAAASVSGQRKQGPLGAAAGVGVSGVAGLLANPQASALGVSQCGSRLA